MPACHRDQTKTGRGGIAHEMTDIVEKDLVTDRNPTGL